MRGKMKLVLVVLVVLCIVSVLFVSTLNAASSTHEAEASSNNVKYATKTENAVEFDAKKDAYIEMKKVNSPANGLCTLTFTYSAEKSVAVEVKVNGSTVVNKEIFDSTDGSWKEKSITADMKSGSDNKIKFKIREAVSGVKLDKVTINTGGSDESTQTTAEQVIKTEEPTTLTTQTAKATEESTEKTAETSVPVTVKSETDSIEYGKTIQVASDGSGEYKTIKSAMESVSKSNSVFTKINIKPGTYKEKFTVDRPKITFSGQSGKEEQTILTYDDTGTSTGFTMKITADDVSVENITIENSTTEKIQAPALMTQSKHSQFRNCRIIGLQDTLYAHSGTQYYYNCYIEGRVDYIFGGATAVFEDCEMKTVQSGSAICAPSTDSSVKWGIIFLGGKVTASSNISSNSQWLARSWGAEGFTAYIGTDLGDHIKDEGWGTMSQNDGKLDQARFYEYKSTGPGANPSARAKEVAPQLSDSEAAEYTIKNIFGSWTPSFSK